MRAVKGKFEFYEHTADVKFRAYGKDLNELFSNCALAMTASLIDPKAIKKVETNKIKNHAKDLQRLLYDFLEEFLFLTDTQGFMLSEVTKINIEEFEIPKKDGTKFTLTAEVIGDNAEKYDFSGDIKSITYHEMFIKKEKGKYTAQVVVDV
jgi:SHS2 domain-containing protein